MNYVTCYWHISLFRYSILKLFSPRIGRKQNRREGGRIQLRCQCNLWLDLKRALAPSPPSTCVCGRAVWEAPSGNPDVPAGSLVLPLPETPFRPRPAEGSPFSVDVCSGSQRWCPAVAPFPLEAAGHAIQASGAQLHCPRSTAIKMKKSFCKIIKN